jgi:hypothetical protein
MAISMNAKPTKTFHPEWIGVLKQKHREKHNEGGFHPAGKKHAKAKPPGASYHIGKLPLKLQAYANAYWTHRCGRGPCRITKYST